MVAIVGDSDNAGSMALHRRYGFEMVGTLRSVGYKLGRWVDTPILQRALGAAIAAARLERPSSGAALRAAWGGGSIARAGTPHFRRGRDASAAGGDARATNSQSGRSRRADADHPPSGVSSSSRPVSGA